MKNENLDTQDILTTKKRKAHKLLHEMSERYNKSFYTKKTPTILEFDFSDISEKMQLKFDKNGCEFLYQNENDYTTRIKTTFKVWDDISIGNIDGDVALFEKLYRVNGDFDILMYLDDYFPNSSQSEKTSVNSSLKKSSMLFVSLPWAYLWISLSKIPSFVIVITVLILVITLTLLALKSKLIVSYSVIALAMICINIMKLMPINPLYGVAVTIVISMSLPLLAQKNKITIYDYVSALAVFIIGAMGLLGVSIELLFPTSFLAVGLMWVCSCFTKIPLTALYSCNDFGGKVSYSNPLFIRINRILTSAWGCLFTFQGVLSFLVLGSDLPMFLILFNEIAPIFMGIFTIWFIKWYPAYYAAK